MMTESMHLHGIDHITGITGDGQRCLDFYAGVLGLAFVGRDREFEAPDSHLIQLGRDRGRDAGVLNFIEAPGVARGRPGDGMLHRIVWGLRLPAALGYWANRLSNAGIPIERVAEDRALRFADPEGMEHEFVLVPSRPGGLETGTGTIPAEHALTGLIGVRAYGRKSVPSADILAGRLGFSVVEPDSYLVGGQAGARFCFDPPPAERGRVGVGTIHHVAWGCAGSLPAWRQRVIGLGCHASPVIDRGRCRSIYFREPSGVLFEIATHTPDGRRADRGMTEPSLNLSRKVDPRVRVG
jgi:glyoxalase family protein